MYLYTHTYVYVNMYVLTTYFHIQSVNLQHAPTTSKKLLPHPLNTRSLFTYIALFQVSFRIYGCRFTYIHAHTSSESYSHTLSIQSRFSHIWVSFRSLFTYMGLFHIYTRTHILHEVTPTPSQNKVWVSFHIYTRTHLLWEVTHAPSQYKVSFHIYRPLSGLFSHIWVSFHIYTRTQSSEKLLTHSLNTRSLFTYIGLFQVFFHIYGSLSHIYTHAPPPGCKSYTLSIQGLCSHM